MHFIWDVESLGNWLTSLIIILLIGVLVFYTFFKIIKRKIPFIFLGVSYALFLVSFIFALQYAAIISAGFAIVVVLIAFIVNLGDFRKFVSNPFKRNNVKNSQHKVEKLFDRASLYEEIEKAIFSLSNSKTGAIITFERNSSLKDVMQNGVPVHAPVTHELLETIFYPGTRLHDGAVIIHGNEIVSASVFFTPTTKAFAGKYGSRHRAAIGISEIADCVTIVVSEETGRVSFAVNGQLETIDRADFKRALENYLG